VAAGKVIAKFSPGVTAIRLLESGEIVYLMIEGPNVSIAAKISGNTAFVIKAIRRFVAAINQWSQAHLVSQQVNRVPVSSGGSDVLERLERLGKLRASGVLTEDEFLAQKAAILRGN
jgi:hypothetical protein